MSEAKKRLTGKQVPARRKTHQHPDHSSEIKRLNRIIGQLEGVRRMVEDRRYCPEILLQTRAVTSAIRSFESAILSQHMRHCLAAAVGSRDPRDIDDKIRELLALFEKRS